MPIAATTTRASGLRNAGRLVKRTTSARASRSSPAATRLQPRGLGAGAGLELASGKNVRFKLYRGSESQDKARVRASASGLAVAHSPRDVQILTAPLQRLRTHKVRHRGNPVRIPRRFDFRVVRHAGFAAVPDDNH